MLLFGCTFVEIYLHTIMTETSHPIFLGFSIVLLIAELAMAYLLHKKYQLAVVSSFFYYLFFINIFAFYGLWNTHLLTLLSGQPSSTLDPIVVLVIKYFAVPFMILGNYFFIKFFRLLSGESLSPGFILFFFGFEFLIFTGTGLSILLTTDTLPVQTLGQALETLFILNDGFCIALALSQVFILRPQDPDQRRLARKMTFYYLILTPLYLTLMALEVHQKASLVNLIIFPLFDLVPLLWLFLALRTHGPSLFSPAIKSGLDALVTAYKITPREKQIIRLICEGKSNKEISEQLYISLQTVKDHNHNIFSKTNVKSRTQLITLINQ